jgi:hypothetical protein
VANSATAIPAARRTEIDGRDLILTTLLNGGKTNDPAKPGGSFRESIWNGFVAMNRAPT